MMGFATLVVWLLGIPSHADLYQRVISEDPAYYGEPSPRLVWLVAAFWPIVELVHGVHYLIHGD